jgi:hypothetical protein
MKRVIALAWAVEPLAFKDCFPPQSTFVELTYGGAESVYLPHADTSRTQVVSTLKTAADGTSFT